MYFKLNRVVKITSNDVMYFGTYSTNSYLFHLFLVESLLCDINRQNSIQPKASSRTNKIGRLLVICQMWYIYANLLINLSYRHSQYIDWKYVWLIMRHRQAQRSNINLVALAYAVYADLIRIACRYLYQFAVSSNDDTQRNAVEAWAIQKIAFLIHSSTIIISLQFICSILSCFHFVCHARIYFSFLFLVVQCNINLNLKPKTL